MNNNHKIFLENIDKNGLLPSARNSELQKNHLQTAPIKNSNIFSQSSIPPFGNLTVQSSQKTPDLNTLNINQDNSIIDGFDTEILSNSKFHKINDKELKLKIKIARLRLELEEHKKIVESSFLKSDKSHYQKLLEIQQKMEAEIQRLVAEYQSRQLKSIVFSPFAKLFHLLKNYVALR